MTAATDDTTRQAAMLEAETLQRAGLITFSQARRRISERQAGPVAHLALQQTDALNQALAALRELHSVVKLMEHDDEMKRPTDAEVDAALLQAEQVLGRH